MALLELSKSIQVEKSRLRSKRIRLFGRASQYNAHHSQAGKLPAKTPQQRAFAAHSLRNLMAIYACILQAPTGRMRSSLELPTGNSAVQLVNRAERVSASEVSHPCGQLPRFIHYSCTLAHLQECLNAPIAAPHHHFQTSYASSLQVKAPR